MIKMITCATPKALYYLPQDLSHTVLILAEAPGGEDADYSFRSILSEGELVILAPEKNPETGVIQTTERRVKGPISLIQTTTKGHLHPENETRNFDIFTDESYDQTEKIFKLDNKRYLGEINPEANERIIKRWHNAFRLIEPMPVIIPYVEHINFPIRPTRVRRDRPRFLAMIESCALLFQHQREIREVNGKKYVVANLDDYEIVRELGSKILMNVLKGATPKCEALIRLASEFGDVVFTKKDLIEKSEHDRKTVKKYIDEAIKLGCIEELRWEPGKSKEYRFVQLLDDVDCVLPTRAEVEKGLSKGVEIGHGQLNTNQ